MLKTVTGFQRQQAGFTLIEIAVVLVIIGILVGSFIGTFADRIETTRRENTSKQLEDIRSAILGFASVHGRLPCPSTTTSAGLEDPNVGGPCTLANGFVPGATLGIHGAYNRDNLLIDSWDNPIRYSVTAWKFGVFTTPYSDMGPPFSPTGMKGEGMAALAPDLVICDGDSANSGGCSAGVNELAGAVPFVILSLGKDGGDFVTTVAADSDQGENAGEVAVAANAGGENKAYTVGNNQVFVSKSYSSVDATPFDDIIIWESPYVLYSRMIEAGQLP